VELRQYTLRPNMRETLIDLFETLFVAPQEEHGIGVIGQFRNLDDDDKFVWLRDFSDMESRREALTAFYTGPPWMRHRDAANGTMLDSDDVLLLRPVRPAQTGTDEPGRDVEPPSGGGSGHLTASIFEFDQPVTAQVEAYVGERLDPLLTRLGATPVALLCTKDAPNTFPALPVRPDHVVVRLARFTSRHQVDQHQDRLADSREWRKALDDLVQLGLKENPGVLRLQATAKSRLA
jgi:hypothetical protein